ncbi:hypothetical protein N0V84_002046 [Fusarium piperis]|uniref:Uncharacterized protein n=1 Tax=Fusarium piperis TaxID=1435070 RepID=A0A9W8WJW9_9HYPO|nr:hypothetical protein N0V84_002046 [Fusarium piperis]
MIKSYFLAPNDSTPAPPGGRVHLGSILRNLTDFEPLNDGRVKEIPPDQYLSVDKKTGFTFSLAQLHSADFGLRAKALELLGLIVNASIGRAKGSNQLISCQRLETHAFIATDSYIEEALTPPIKAFMQSSRSGFPVYMVTGLKIAYSASRTSGTTKSIALEANVGFVPPGTPVRPGMRAGLEKSHEEGAAFEDSSPIILSFKVKKIWLEGSEEVKHEAHTAKAVMLDGTPSYGEPVFTIRSDDELTLEEVNDMFGKEEDGI